MKHQTQLAVIGLNDISSPLENAHILNSVTTVTPKNEAPPPMFDAGQTVPTVPPLEPQGIQAENSLKIAVPLLATLSDDCTKNNQNQENDQIQSKKCYTLPPECYTDTPEKDQSVTPLTNDICTGVTVDKKQSISLNDMAKLSRANKAKWYAEQGFDVLLGVRGRKGGGTGWNSPTRQAMTPQQAYATFNATNRTTNTVIHCGTRSKPMGSAGLLVVDVDIKNVRNDQEHQECHTALKAMLGDMYDYATVTSVSGGLHYYIAVPAHQAHLIPDTATLSLQSGEEYETQTHKGSHSKKKAWEIELISTGKTIQAIPSKIGDKEYTLNTGTIHQEIPPSIVSLIETWQAKESEPPEDTSAQITILEEPRAFIYCVKGGETKGYVYSQTYVQHYDKYIKSDGLYLAGTQKINGDGVTVIVWDSPTRIGNVIYPLATLDDGKGYSFGMLLEFISQHGHTHRHALDLKQFVGDGMALFSLLRELGYHWQDLPQYRQAIRLWLNNAKPDNRLIGKQECGWTNDCCFVLPDNVIGDDNGLYYYQGGVQRTDIYETKGNIDTWRNEIAKPCEPYPLLCLGVMLGFTAPLLRLLNIDTCGVHIWGESSSGKTTAARLGASVWGACSKGTNANNRIVSWNATATGFELQAALHSGSLLVLDEMGEAENKDDIATTIYKLSDGRTKSRGQADLTIRASKTWQLLACSTGERKIQEHIGITKKLPVGVLMRFLEIPVNTGDGCGVLEGMTNKSERQAFITRLESALSDHYGLACRPYLETLCAQLKQPEALSELKESYQSLVSDFSQGGTSQHARGAKVFAALALGGTLATEQGLTGWQESRAFEVAKLLYGRWREGFGEGVKEQSDFSNHLEAWLAQNIAHFAPVLPYAPYEFLGTGLEKNPHETIKPFYGYTTVEGDYWLLPMAFDTVREGIGRDSAITALYVKKWLVDPISAYQKGATPRKTIAGKRNRLIHIRLNNA